MVNVSTGVLAFSGITHTTLAAVFDKDEFGLDRQQKRAAKPAWDFQGKGTKKEIDLSYLVKQKLRMHMVTYLCIYRKRTSESEESNFS